MNDESNDRVRRSTSTSVNADIDCKTDTNIARYGDRPRGEITARITELEREWDGVQGCCPLLPILRSLGIRMRGEIDREKYALLGCEVAFQRAPARARRYH